VKPLSVFGPKDIGTGLREQVERSRITCCAWCAVSSKPAIEEPSPESML